MQRRAALELSVRRDITQCWTVRLARIILAPVSLHASKRSFRSSAAFLDETDNFSSTTPTSDGAVSRSLFSGDKFSARWSKKPVIGSSALSAADNASREAILASQAPLNRLLQLDSKRTQQGQPSQSRTRSNRPEDTSSVNIRNVSWRNSSRYGTKSPRLDGSFGSNQHDQLSQSSVQRNTRTDGLSVNIRRVPWNSSRSETKSSHLNGSFGSNQREPPSHSSHQRNTRADGPSLDTRPRFPHHAKIRAPGTSQGNAKQPSKSSQSSEPGGTSVDSIKRPRYGPFPVPLLKKDRIGVPFRLRHISWDCPECQHHCFGEDAKCPCCNTVRPGLSAVLDKRAKFSDPFKIRKVAQSLSTEFDPVSKGKSGEETAEMAKNSVASSAESAEQAATKQDIWAWDSSYLDKLKENERLETASKSMKQRMSRRQRGSDVDDNDFDEDERRGRRQARKRSKKDKLQRTEVDTAPSPLYLPAFISVSNLADVIGVRPAQFVQRMEEMGFEDVTFGHVLDAETAGLVAAEYNFEPIFDQHDDDLTAAPQPEDMSSLPPRPPVVTIMGHVDHGKTTILDWLRKSSIAASEHGGITQHIGAFSVAMPSGKTITFLDTPGHAAFLDMRRRGANVTDIVVLVVAADDSVKPQTVEAIKHATEAKVPIIVAISKVDKDDGNPEKVKQDLSVHGINVEDYGGDVQAIPVSGKTGQGMIELEEAIVALSEMQDHRADTEGNSEGWVIEASTKPYGRVASALVRRGTLRPGDIIVAGTTWARVRTLRNEAGVSIDEATPGMPVEIDGWKELPTAGSEIIQAESEQQAKDVVASRQERSETQKLGEDAAAINEARRDLLAKRRQEEEGKTEESSSAAQEPSGPQAVNFLVKADVAGSVEAVLNSVSAVGNNEVFACIIRSGVGPVSEFDIEHAAAAKGYIVSFNMQVDPAMNRMAESRGVKILDHNIIYKLIDDVKSTLSEYLSPIVSHRVTGEAEISQIFEITIKGREKTSIAGCKVRNGVVNRTKKVRVLRNQEIVYDGTISSLKNVKKDVTEMRKDTECGIGFEAWTDFSVGDHIQCYDEIYEKRSL